MFIRRYHLSAHLSSLRGLQHMTVYTVKLVWHPVVHLVGIEDIDLVVVTLAEQTNFMTLCWYLQTSGDRPFSGATVGQCSSPSWLHDDDHRRGNNFLVGEAQIGKKQDNQIQSKISCNVYFSKKVYAEYNGVRGKATEAGKFSRIFVLKVTLQSVRLLITVSYRKKLGEQDVLVTPPIILLGEQMLLQQN